jgi:hypothetical protein
MDQEDKVRENRLRRIAERRGFRLEKSRRRDRKAPDFGAYALFNKRNELVAGDQQNATNGTLDRIEDYLEALPDR